MIRVIDYGMGNLRSVVKAVEIYTPHVSVASHPDEVNNNDTLILPGDGAFGMAMQHLDERGWSTLIREHIANDGFFLGICLGFQLLFESSVEFGEHKGLGIIPGKVVKFDDPGLKIPHMGWNNVTFKNTHPFLDGIKDGSFFYFIHTFYPQPEDPDWIIGEAEYGKKFACMVGKGNVMATQFHPEKSHSCGLKIIENFVRKACS